MTERGQRNRRVAARIGLASLLAAAAFAPGVASATTQTKFYSVHATWSNTPGFVGVADTMTVVFGNEPYSQQSFGSTQLTFNSLPPGAVQVVGSSLPTGWSAQVLAGTVAVVRFTNSGAAIQPGGTLTVQLTVTPTAVGTVTVVPRDKQSNNFSGSGNDFVLDSSSGLSLTVVPLTLQFAQQPSSRIGQSLPGAAPPYFAYFCNPVSVQTYANGLPVAAAGVPVTLNFAGSADPGLYSGTAAVGTAGVTVTTDSTGLATFGSCASGLGATVVGLGYTLGAASPDATGTATSSAFQVLQTCVSNCTTNNSSTTTGTGATVTAGTTGIFQIFTSFGQGVVLSCDVAVSPGGAAVDPLFALTQSTAGTVSGTITLVFPASLSDPWEDEDVAMPVCAGASAAFPAKGNPATGQPWPGSLAFPFQGLLYSCGSSTYKALVASGSFPAQLCVKSQTETAGDGLQIVVSVSDLSDPSFW